MGGRTASAATRPEDASPVAQLCAAEDTDDPAAAIVLRAGRLLDVAAGFGALENLPVPIEVIASFAGITAVTDVPDLSVAAQLVPDVDGRRLRVERRAEDPFGRRRFSCGHEIGHTLMPNVWAQPRHCRGGESSAAFGTTENDVERLCDVAAAELLLPTRLVRPWLRDRPATVGTVLDLAAAGGASLVAAGRRVVDLAEEPVSFAVVTPRLSKTQEHRARIAALQVSLPGFDSGQTDAPKFRLDYLHRGRGPFVPPHKSFAPEPFVEASKTGRIATATDRLTLHGRPLDLAVSVVYAPVRIEGTLRDRFLAVLTAV